MPIFMMIFIMTPGGLHGDIRRMLFIPVIRFIPATPIIRFTMILIMGRIMAADIGADGVMADTTGPSYAERRVRLMTVILQDRYGAIRARVQEITAPSPMALFIRRWVAVAAETETIVEVVRAREETHARNALFTAMIMAAI